MKIFGLKNLRTPLRDPPVEQHLDTKFGTHRLSKRDALIGSNDEAALFHIVERDTELGVVDHRAVGVAKLEALQIAQQQRATLRRPRERQRNLYRCDDVIEARFRAAVVGEREFALHDRRNGGAAPRFLRSRFLNMQWRFFEHCRRCRSVCYW